LLRRSSRQPESIAVSRSARSSLYHIMRWCGRISLLVMMEVGACAFDGVPWRSVQLFGFGQRMAASWIAGRGSVIEGSLLRAVLRVSALM
jgi:hypothetical protein